MSNGYVERELDSRVERGMTTHIEQHYHVWRQSAQYNEDFDVSWVIVTAAIKTTSWSLAATTKGFNLKSRKQATAALKKGGKGDSKFYWSADADIHTRHGPLEEETELFDSYLQSPHAQAAGQRALTEAKECHCVALRGYTLDKVKGFRRGSQDSVISTYSNKTALPRRIYQTTSETINEHPVLV